MEKLKALFSRSKGYATAAAAGLVIAAPMANAAGDDPSAIVAGLAVATTITGIIAAATLKGSVNVVMMGARRVLSMLR